MNHDLALISACLKSGDLSEALREGIKPHHLGDEAQQFWDILIDHYDTFHEVPSVPYFTSICPSFDFNPPSDSVQVLAHELKTRHLHTELDDALQSVAELNAVDPWEAKQRLLSMAEKISIENTKGDFDLIAGHDKEEVLKILDQIRNGAGLLGYPWPWDYLNENTLGCCPGDFYYFYGREKSKKTWLCIFLALFWADKGFRVLFVTREMPKDQISWRAYAMACNLPFRAMTKGEISTDGLVRLEDVMDYLADIENLIITEVGDGMTGLTAKVDEIKPHIVIHDFMFALAEDAMVDKKNPSEHRYVARVATQLKRLAMDRKIPVIACGHANRDGVKLKGKSTTEVAHSDHIMRKVDMGGRIISDKHEPRTAIIINAGRNVRDFFSWTITSGICENFGQFLSVDTSWIDAVDKVDEEEAESKSRNDVAPPTGDVKSEMAGAFRAKKKTPFRRG